MPDRDRAYGLQTRGCEHPPYRITIATMDRKGVGVTGFEPVTSTV